MAGPVDLLVGTTAGIAVGTAAADALAPALEPPKQAAWKSHPNKVLDASRLAQLVAQGLTKLDTAHERAKRTGWSENNLDALVQLAMVAPGTAEVLELWRRNPSRPRSEQISEAQVDHALAKAMIEPQYWPAIKELFHSRLDPAVLAVAIQRGIMQDPGFLPVGPPSAQGKVPKFPVSPLDPLVEAQAAGIDSERLFVETAIVGNPASPDLAARMTFRSIIDKVDYDRAIAEGNTRNEWADFLFDGFREILTANQWVELHLRGYITQAEMYDGTALHGMSRDDSDRLFRVLGRPLVPHQITTGLARGGQFNPIPGELTDPYEASVHEANIKPSYYDLAIANRYSYPSGFQIKGETQNGDLLQPESEQILLEIGWSPKWAKFFSTKWALGKATATKEATAANLRAEYEGLFIDRATLIAGLTQLGYSAHDADQLAELGDAARVKRERDAYIAAVKKSYLNHLTSGLEARADLVQAGLSTEAIDSLTHFWALELEIPSKVLTPAQIAARFKRQTITQAVALQALSDRGYTPADSAILLELALPVLTANQIQAAVKSEAITPAQALAQLTEQGYSPAQAAEIIEAITGPDTTLPAPGA